MITKTTDSEPIGIIGVGKLGLAYALSFDKHDVRVWASSYRADYVYNLQRKITDSVEPGIAELLARSRTITFTIDNHQVIENCDVIYVMVATPSLLDGNYDVSAIDAIIIDLLEHAGEVAGKILVIGSTVNPGDCVRFQKQLDQRGVHVVYSPTFAAQGSVLNDIENPIAVSFGTTDDRIAGRCMEIFSSIIPKDTPIHQLHPTTAEIMKLAGNCYGTLRINFYNFVGQLLLASGLEQDLDQANHYLREVDRRKDSLRFGFGYGGPCYPRDNRSFKHFSDRLGLINPLAQANDTANQSHAQFLCNYLLTNNKNDLPFYFEYVSYKQGVKIFEESHQLKVCENLLAKGAWVCVKDSPFLDHDLIAGLRRKYQDRIWIDDGKYTGSFYRVEF